MSDPYYGEIRMFAGNYAPRSWALCDGQLLPISQHNELFALLGTCYGGDGTTTFALPDLRGRVPIHQGRGPGLSNHQLGDRFGSKEVILTSNQLPRHTHPLEVLTDPDTSQEPEDKILANTTFNLYNNNATAETMVEMWEGSIDPSGVAQPHSHYNMQPYLCVSFIICLNGFWPPRP